MTKRFLLIASTLIFTISCVYPFLSISYMQVPIHLFNWSSFWKLEIIAFATLAFMALYGSGRRTAAWFVLWLGILATNAWLAVGVVIAGIAALVLWFLRQIEHMREAELRQARDNRNRVIARALRNRSRDTNISN